jgi:aminopeptidase C
MLIPLAGYILPAFSSLAFICKKIADEKIPVCLYLDCYYIQIGSSTCSGPVFPAGIHLTDSVSCTPVKDQSQSPTCWVFGTNSLFESDYIKKYHTVLDLSEMFIARYAYIDKAIKYLATKGKTYFEGGGQFHDVIRVVNKYGMVPEEAYPGKPNVSITITTQDWTAR